jgi:protein-L-isoaspartate(D-aspartate) O-methyltransferase
VAPSGLLTRRGLIGATAALWPLGRAFAAAPWTRAAYERAMRESGRPVSLTDQQFADIQARKPAAMKLIASYLKGRLGSADPAVLGAFEAVPREYFHYEYQDHRSMGGEAYEAEPKPWAIGYGSALSDYLGQAYMTQVAQPKPEDYSIEIIEPLGKAVSRIFAPLGYANVRTRVGDGYYGWPEVEGGFDLIIVTCAAQFAPPDLFKQMKPGGRLIIPIGQPFKRGQVLYVYTKDAEGKIHSRRDMGVFFIPMTGAMTKEAAAHTKT